MIGTQLRLTVVLKMLLAIAAVSFESAHALPVDEVRRAQTEKDKADAKQAAPKAHAEQPAKRDATRTRQRDVTDTATPQTAPTPTPRIRQPFAEEIDRYINVFGKQNVDEQIQACRELEFAGLSDTRIFDLVENHLLEIYYSAHDGDSVDYATWLTRALAYSGREKYRNTLQLVANSAGHRKLSKQAGASLKMLDDYTRWTPIIGSTTDYRYDKSPDINRLMNMVRGPDASLQQLATNRMLAENQYDADLLQVVQQKVSATLANKADNASEDALIRMLRLLAESRNADYRPVLEDAAAHAASKHVRKYAASYLKKHR